MNRNEIQLLFGRDARPQPSVLSVYLNVDQSQPANLGHGLETQLKQMLGAIRTTKIQDALDQQRFSTASRRVTEFLSAYAPKGRGLIMFFDDTDGFFWHMETEFSVMNQARWDYELLLVPLANALDQFERYGVVLVDRANFRLFSVFLREIEEVVRGGIGSLRVRHIKTAGTDHLASASRIQRKADERVRLNLRKATAAVDAMVQTGQVHRLILAGTPEITAELQTLLPKRLALLVIGVVEITMDSLAKDVLEATRDVAAKYECDTELQTVREVVTAAAKKQRAVVGLGHTLKAINSERMWQMVYSQDFSCPGFECVKCSALFSIKRATCSYCGADIRPIDDVIEHAVEHALRKGSRIEVVTGDAAASLARSGAIGGFLKTRSGTVQV